MINFQDRIQEPRPLDFRSASIKKPGEANTKKRRFLYAGFYCIPSGPSNGVCISQLVRYARCCTYHDDFGYRHKLPVDRLLSQRYKVNRPRNSFKQFYGGYLSGIPPPKKKQRPTFDLM